MKKKKWLALLVLPGAAVAAYFALESGSQPIKTYEVGRGTVTDALEASGTVEPAWKMELSSLEGGTIARIAVAEGDQVEAGQLLCALDSSALLKKLEATEAMAASASLAGEDTEARMAVEDLLAQVDRCSIDSPKAGMVYRIYANDGETAMPGSPILELGSPDKIVTVEVAAYDGHRLQVGQRAIIALPDGSNLRATVSHVQPAGSVSADASSGGTIVRVQLTPDRAIPLVVGASAQTVIQCGTARGVVVPLEALASDDDGYYVMRMAGDRAELCRVEVGLTDDQNAEIISGLSTGDSIAADPYAAKKGAEQ